MALSDLDRQRLRDALLLAEQAIGLSDPNPRVGCVIGHADGTVLGRGFTQRAGQAHAEVMAMRDAGSTNLHGATAWVTLEPCSHHGRTPPCCDALLAAGIGRVVVAVQDPNPVVSGRGMERLRAHGVHVELDVGDLAAQARRLNVGFFSRMERARPWVRLKAAASIDNVTALHNGASQWITGAAARRDGHAWRKRANAILTGIGTVLADDPRLDVREVETQVQPLRVVLDSQLRTPPSARLIQTPGRAIVVATHAEAEARRALEQSGATVLAAEADPAGHIALAPLLHMLSRDEAVNELHVEAGSVLAGALFAAGLVDELLLYSAPCLLGSGGRPFAQLPRLDRLADRVPLRITDVRMVGDDIRTLALVLHDT